MSTRFADAVRSMTLRRQQLLFFSVVTVFVLVLIGTSIGVTARYARVFGSNLNRYFLIHELRTALSSADENLDLYSRTRDESFLDAMWDDATRVRDRYLELVRLEFADVPSRLEVRAIYYGLRAYERAARDGIDRFAGDPDDAYRILSRAHRIQGYIDMYLERLFQIQLEAGQKGYEIASIQQERIRVFGLGGIVVVAAALTTFALLFSRSVTRPLDQLVAEAHALAAGEFDRGEMALPESRELREVALAFNRMTRGIRELVADLKDQHELERKLHQQELSNMSMERHLREAQLVALQSQINPHFLFNTLNSVARTARIEGARGSERLIRGLSSVLRYILRNPRQSVSLREEMRVIEDYLALQAVRFGSRLIYRIEVADTVEDVQIPPLILQPLVENAVIYGVEPKEEGGTVTVSAAADTGGNRLVLTVRDDGTGMDQEMIGELMRREIDTTGDATSGIGVLNVRARLALFFGEDHRFSIDGAPGTGTTVTVEVPRQSRAERYAFHSSDR
ncbi:MAG: sensor histidine kinase [Alkalispirochaeta sp.]